MNDTMLVLIKKFQHKKQCFDQQGYHGNQNSIERVRTDQIITLLSVGRMIILDQSKA